MPNTGGRQPDPNFRRDEPVSASKLNAIVNALARRIIGDGRTVKVRTFGDQLIVEGIPQKVTKAPVAKSDAVDFFVDNFDRDDADSLGDLWDDPSGFAIRDKKCFDASVADRTDFSIAASGGCSASVSGPNTPDYSTPYSLNAGPNSDSGNPPIPPEGSTQGDTTVGLTFESVPVVYHSRIDSFDRSHDVVNTVYKSVLGSKNYNVRVKTVTGNHPSTRNTGPYGGSVFRLGVGIPNDNRDRGSLLDLALGKTPSSVTSQGAAASISSTYNGPLGPGFESVDPVSASAQATGESSSSGDFVHAAISAHDQGGGGRDVVGPTTRIKLNNRQSETDLFPPGHGGSGGGVSCFASSTVNALPNNSYGVVSGENDILYEVREGKVTCKINGQVLYSDQDLYTVDGGLVGLGNVERALGNHQQGITSRYITQIKAWKEEVTEPPDAQSGHGTWTSVGGFAYTDKYHAGGGYNPNA